MRFTIVLRTLPPAAALVAALITGTALAQITAVPPATYVPPSVPKSAPVQRLLSADAPGRTVALGTPTATERGILKAANTVGTTSGKLGARAAVTGKGRPLAIGFGRTIPVRDRTISGADLAWQPVADGGRAARIDVTSDGAAAVRVALAMAATDPDVSVRFEGSADGATVFGPYPANGIAEATARDGKYWSPVLEGDTATIELYLPAGVAPDSIGLTLAGISHLVVAGDGLRKVDPKAGIGIGTSESCEIDVACVMPQSPALLNEAKSIAKIVFMQDDGNTYLCSGTLVNDSIASLTPYFYTAAHCITSQTAATTLNLYFFYDAVTCQSKATPPYVLVTGGAMLLGRSDDWDWALLRLNATPPPGSTFSAWNASPLTAALVDAIVLHHPNADLKKWSAGKTQGAPTFSDGSSQVQVIYSQGSTEPGSSGAPLLTLNFSGTFYELRGGLYGGDADCSNPNGSDYYSRLDNALPELRQYLTPDAPNPTGVVPVVEFYDAALDLYFMSTDPGEINDLDTGVHAGWVRTGLRFLVYSDPALAPADANPVCRFYEKPEAPGSHGAHFYSPTPTECADTLQKFGDNWILESSNVFYIQVPDQTTGVCPANTRPVWRYFNSNVTNHRYTVEVFTRNLMSADPSDWTPEGYGPGPYYPIMCSPLQ